MFEAKIVGGMALVRFLAGTIELSAALLMLKCGRIDTAFRINAVLGLIGPAVLVAVSCLGLVGLAGRIPFHRILTIALGILLIFFGVRDP